MDVPFSSWEIRIGDVVDVVLVATLFALGITWLRRSRARLALVGLAIVGAVYLLARQLGLQLTAWILQGFFAVFVIVLVVVFQEDLRRLFEQIAMWGLRRRPAETKPSTVDAIVRAMASLAGERRGALLIFPGQEPLDRHLEGGILLDARVSEPLLLSIFDPHSPGHDGAVLLKGDRVARFAVHLPLSSDAAQLVGVGTRHAAALGLAERTDALCIVVSEERGTVSVAREGRLRRLRSPEALGAIIQEYLAAREARVEVARSPWRAVGARWRDALGGLGLALALWLLLVPGSRIIQVTETAEVVIENLPPGYELEAVEPPDVQITLSGPLRDQLLARRGRPRIEIDAFLAKLGRRTFQIDPSEIEHPGGLQVVGAEPTSVRIHVRTADESETSEAEPKPPVPASEG